MDKTNCQELNCFKCASKDAELQRLNNIISQMSSSSDNIININITNDSSTRDSINIQANKINNLNITNHKTSNLEFNQLEAKYINDLKQNSFNYEVYYQLANLYFSNGFKAKSNEFYEKAIINIIIILFNTNMYYI